MRKLVVVSVTSISCFFILCALVVICIINPVMRTMITKQARLIPGSLVFQEWQEPSIPIYLQFFFFNLTNAEEFYAGAKPNLHQRGPYTYFEKRFKIALEVNEQASTISYKEVKQYFFRRELSVGPESDLITNVNLVYLTLANKIDQFPQILIYIIEMAEERFGDQLIMQRSVKEWLWGYEDPFLAFINRYIPIGMTKIGLYVDKNNTDDGFYKIDSGIRDSKQFGRVLEYHGNKSLSCWTTPSTNQINGSDGSLFHPFLENDEYVDIFAADICRSIRFIPHGLQTIHGIATQKYLPMEDTFDSPSENEKNRGFCPHWPVCFGTGVIDMSTCQPGPPIAMSMPHFVHANETYQHAVIGMHPSAEFNTTFFIEPTTGVVVSAAKKLQLNANITSNSRITELSRVSTVLLPVMFVNESVTVDKPTVQLLRHAIFVIPLIVKIVAIAVGLLSLSVLIAVTLAYVRERQRESNPETQPLLREPSAVAT